MVEPSKDNKRIHKLKPWLFSLCSRLSTDAVIGNDAPSLGHYLQAERRGASTYRRNQFPTTYGPNGFSPIQDSTSLLVGSQIDPNREMEEWWIRNINSFLLFVWMDNSTCDEPLLLIYISFRGNGVLYLFPEILLFGN